MVHISYTRTFLKGYARVDPDGVASLQLWSISFEDDIAFGQCPCNLESQIPELSARDDSSGRKIDISFALWVVLVTRTENMGPYAAVRDVDCRDCGCMDAWNHRAGEDGEDGEPGSLVEVAYDCWSSQMPLQDLFVAPRQLSRRSHVTCSQPRLRILS
jgi:hypothetical protein